MKYRLSYFSLLLFILIVPTTILIAQASVPLQRSSINTKPIATFEGKVKANSGEYPITVQLFETKQTHQFLLVIKQLKDVHKDTVTIPNLGTMPRIQLQPGTSSNSCIVGFLDNKNNFKPYKAVIATGLRVRVKVLHRYAVYTHTTTVQ
jgi:hypothetical protein